MENSKKRVPIGETNVIQEYLDGASVRDLADKYGFTRQNVSQYLKRNGIKIEQRIFTQSPYTLDEHWLDELDCQEKYYFCGMFFADGTNSVDRNQIRMKLHIKDIDRLKLFQKWFHSNRPLLPLDKDGEIRTYGNCKEMVLTSKHLCDRLTELGAPDNKSTILQFPGFVPDDMMNHFIRGYFDGDGSITLFAKTKNGEVRANVTFVSSHDFIKGLNQYLEDHLSIRPNVYHRENFSLLKIEKAQELKKFLDWLYQNANCFMARKHDRAVEFLNGRDFSIETSYDKRNRIVQDKDIIIQRYLDGESGTKIAKDYGCAVGTMAKWLHKWGVEIRKNTTPQQRALMERQKQAQA